MGYSTDFIGQFDINKKLDPKTLKFLTKLATTRRMKRNVDPKYGVEGEFYVESTEDFGQDRDNPNIIDYNRPPSTQPSLWLQWIPSEDGLHIQWDGNEKFHHYMEWLQYLIDKILEPKGYIINGAVKYQGEDPIDKGKVIILNNNTVIALPQEILKHIKGNPVEYLQDKKNLPPLLSIDKDFDKWIEKQLRGNN